MLQDIKKDKTKIIDTAIIVVAVLFLIRLVIFIFFIVLISVGIYFFVKAMLKEDKQMDKQSMTNSVNSLKLPNKSNSKTDAYGPPKTFTTIDITDNWGLRA